MLTITGYDKLLSRHFSLYLECSPDFIRPDLHIHRPSVFLPALRSPEEVKWPGKDRRVNQTLPQPGVAKLPHLLDDVNPSALALDEGSDDLEHEIRKSAHVENPWTIRSLCVGRCLDIHAHELG